MTVEQALSVHPLSEGKLIAGSKGKDRVITSVNVMDAPDITDWIKEGELLLTTAYLINDHPEDACQLLRTLHERGSAALGIKLGRFWTEVPESLIEQANELGFPIIELPSPFTFSDQMNGLFRAEMKRSTGVLTDVLNKQIQLMRFALKPKAIQQLFDSIAEVVEIPLAVVGSRGQIVYNGTSMPGEEIAKELRGQRAEGWVACKQAQALRIPLIKHTSDSGFVLFFQSELLVTPVEEGLYYQAAELIAYHMNFSYEDYFELSVLKDFGLLIKHLWYRYVLTDFAGLIHKELRTEKLEMLKSEYLSNSSIQQLKGTHLVMEEGLLSVSRPMPPMATSLSLQRSLRSSLQWRRRAVMK